MVEVLLPEQVQLYHATSVVAGLVTSLVFLCSFMHPLHATC